MANKQDFSKKILKILSEKPAISLPELKNKIIPLSSPAKASVDKYALSRSLKGLKEAGLIESLSSGQNDYARLTKEGKKKVASIKLENDTSIVSPNWDGLWRIVLLDLPEERKSEREALRYLLKKAGFVCLKNSVWISMYPFEHLFANIKNDLGLTTEIMIFVTAHLDSETEKAFMKMFKK